MAEDKTEFYISILAQMTGAGAAVSDIATLGDKMLATGAVTADFERTIKSMSSALEDSGSAVKTTSDALVTGEARYQQLERSADRAAKAVERLAASGNSGDAFAKRQAEAATKAEQAAAALKLEAGVLDALKAKASAAATGHDALTKGLKNVKSAAAEAAKVEAAARGSGKVNEIAEAFGKLGGPAGQAGQKVFGLASGFAKLGGSIGSAGPYVAAAVAIVAIGTAALFATVAVGNWAVGLADANRSQSLLTAGVARSVAGGAELDDTIDRLGGTVPQTREELLGMAGDLAKTGLRGKDLSNALEDAAVKAAELKWGPDFAKQMTSLDVQSRRFGSNLAKTFGGLKIESLLDGISTLVALFDSSTASGKALKFLFESLFQPIIDGTAGAIPSVERLFLQAEILALKAYIALKPYREEIMAVGKALLVGAAVIVGVVVAAFALLAVNILAVVAYIGSFVYGLLELPAFLKMVGEAIGDFAFAAVTFLSDLGSNMIKGLVDGITGGATAVVDSIKNVVGGGIKAAEQLLGIGSPSKVFAGIGDFTAQGFAQGVDSGSGDAQSALEAMVAPPGAKSGAAGAGGGSNIEINITVDGKGASDDGLAAKIAAAVRDVFESGSVILGGGEAAT